jgi:hypothetical protein
VLLSSKSALLVIALHIHIFAITRAQCISSPSPLSFDVDLRVPKVYDVFSDGAGSTYLVMEYITAPSFHTWISEPDLSAEEQTRRTDVFRMGLLCPMRTAALPQSILEKDIASIIVIVIIILRVTGRRSGRHRGKLANTKFGSSITAECFECDLYALKM